MIGNDKQKELEMKKAKQLEYKKQLDFQQQQYPSPSKQQQRRGQQQQQPHQEKERERERERGGGDDAYLLQEERNYSSQQQQQQYQPPQQYQAHPSSSSNYDRSLPSHSSYLPPSAASGASSNPSSIRSPNKGGAGGGRIDKITSINESDESRNQKKIEQEKYRKFLDVQVKQKVIEKEMEKMEEKKPPRGGYEEELGRESIKQPLTGRRGEKEEEKSSNGYVQSVQKRESERGEQLNGGGGGGGDYEYPIPSSSMSSHHHRENSDRDRLFEARNPSIHEDGGYHAHLGSISEEERDSQYPPSSSYHPSTKQQQQQYPYPENTPMLSPNSTLQPQYPSPRAIARSQLVKDIYGKNNMFDAAEEDGPSISQNAGRAGKGDRKHGVGDDMMGRESNGVIGREGGGDGGEGEKDVGGPGTTNWKPSGKNYKSERTKDSIVNQKAALDAQRADIESRKQQEKEKERLENEKYENRIREETERQAAITANEKEKKRKMLEEQNKNLSDLQLKSEQEALARKNRHSSLPSQQQPQQQQPQQQPQQSSPPRNNQNKYHTESPARQQLGREYEEDFYPPRHQHQQQQQQLQPEQHYSSSRKPPPAVNPSSHIYEDIHSPLKEEVFRLERQQQLLQMQQPPVSQKGKGGGATVESKWKNEELTSALRQKWSDTAPGSEERDNDYHPYERDSYDAGERERGGHEAGGGGMISAAFKPRVAGVPPLVSKNGELQAYPQHGGYPAAGSQHRLATPDSIDHFVSNFSARGEGSSGIASGGGGGRIFLPSAGDSGRPPSSSSAAAKQFRSKVGGNHSNAMQETLFQQQHQNQQPRHGQNHGRRVAYDDEEGDIDLSKVSESKLILSNPWNSDILSALGREDEAGETEEGSEAGGESSGRRHFPVKPSLSTIEPQSVSRPSTRNRKEKSKNQLEQSIASNSYFVTDFK
jgi:hypothetical protein